MRHILGKTPKEMLASVDSILEGLLKRQEMITQKLNKKQHTPFSISGYVDTCISGEIIGNYFSLADVAMKRIVVRLDKQEEDSNIFINVRVVAADASEHNITAKLKKDVTYIKDEWRLNRGDRIYTSIDFSGDSPEGIWVGMRGDRK